MTANFQLLHGILIVAQHYFVIGLLYHWFYLSSFRDPSFWNTSENRSEPSPSRCRYSPWTLLSSHSGLVMSCQEWLQLFLQGLVGGSVGQHPFLHCRKFTLLTPVSPPWLLISSFSTKVHPGRKSCQWHPPSLAQEAQGSFLPFPPHDDSCVSSRTLPAQAPICFPLVSSIHPATQTGQGRAVFSCSSCQPAQQCHSLCRGTA